VQVRLLGPFEVEMAGRPIEISSARQRTVLATLAMHAGRPVPVERLIDALWGDDPPHAALNSLQSHVARLRRALGGPGTVVLEPAGYRLTAPPDGVDAWCFEDLLRQARSLPRGTGAADRLDRALALWRGEPLPELTSGPARAWATRLTDLHRTALADRAELALLTGQPDDAVAGLTPDVAADPCWERGTGVLTRALAAAGRVGDAVTVLRRHREAVIDTLGLDPSPAMTELHTALLRGELTAPAPPPTLGADHEAPDPDVSSRVPLRFSSFVGRADEQARLTTLLDAPGLVSVTGPGGVGKTRLVMETVRTGSWPAQVSWVDVADVRGRDDFLQTVAIGAGARPAPGDDPLRAVADAAARQPRLLVLDNCEHVIEPAAEVVEAILAAAPRTRVVVTSQERLRVDNERVLLLAPLPRPGAVPAVEEPEVRLFLDRAGAAVDPADAAQLAAVGEIVDRLDALPLAIELAATQAMSLGLEELRARLGDRLDLLSRGRRTSDPRHRTLRALVDWSHELLPEPEARVLRRLAIFVGGFTVHLAERVACDDTLPQTQVAAVIAALVDRSLVARHGPRRYRLLETLRAYAGERLTRSGEAGATLRRHAGAVTEAAEAEDVRLHGPAEADAVRALDALLPDLRRAREYALATGDDDILVRLAAAMYRYGYHRQRYEVLAWGLDAARLPGTHPRLPVALAAAATHAWGRGDLRAARHLAERALSAAPHLLAPGTHAAYEVLGDVTLVNGEAEASLAYYRARADVGRRIDAPAVEASAFAGMALVLAFSGQTPDAERAAGTAVDLAEASGNPTARIEASYSLGEALGDTRPAQAVALLQEAATIARSVDNRLFEGAAGTAAVAIGSRHGDPTAALTSFHDVLTLWRRAGNTTLQTAALRNLVVLLARIGADEAAATIDTALRAGSDAYLYRAEAERLARARTAVAERLGPGELARVERRAAALSAAQVLDLALDAITAQLARPER
jgi:predicted ATPase/DNA-binding SARP family transcriptional activator